VPLSRRASGASVSLPVSVSVSVTLSSLAVIEVPASGSNFVAQRSFYLQSPPARRSDLSPPGARATTIGEPKRRERPYRRLPPTAIPAIVAARRAGGKYLDHIGERHMDDDANVVTFEPSPPRHYRVPATDV
jgi:hypothetical protein